MCASSSACEADRASEILDVRSAWAGIRQRSLGGCHPLKTPRTGAPLFALILSPKCLVIMCQLTHVTTSRYTRPHTDEMMAVHGSWRGVGRKRELWKRAAERHTGVAVVQRRVQTVQRSLAASYCEVKTPPHHHHRSSPSPLPRLLNLVCSELEC